MTNRLSGVGGLTDLTQDVFDESSTDNNVGFKSIGSSSKNKVYLYIYIFVLNLICLVFNTLIIDVPVTFEEAQQESGISKTKFIICCIHSCYF